MHNENVGLESLAAVLMAGLLFKAVLWVIGGL
jgi:hypothetical protein